MTTPSLDDLLRQQERLQTLALEWEKKSNMMKPGPSAGTRTCAADLYEVVGVPEARMRECACGRYEFQHVLGETCR